jgi:hypothetical protein
MIRVDPSLFDIDLKNLLICFDPASQRHPPQDPKNSIKGKGKIHPITGHEGPEVE